MSSYLLIGFYYTKPAAIAASKKAFIVTRFADLGFLIGILVYGYYAGTYTFSPNEMALAKGGAAMPVSYRKMSSESFRRFFLPLLTPFIA